MKKQSLKSNLFDMKQYQIAADQVFGGDKGTTSQGSNDASDSFTSFQETINTNWGSDVVLDFPGDPGTPVGGDTSPIADTAAPITNPGPPGGVIGIG